MSEQPAEEFKCETCESTDIARRPRLRYFLVVAVVAIGVGLLGENTEAAFFVVAAAAIFAMIADKWVCAECGNSWK